MTTATQTKQNAQATKTTGRGRRTPSPAATKPEQVPTPVAAVPKPRAPRNGNGSKVQTKKAKVTIESHFIPGKVAMATMTPDALNELAFVSTYTTQDPQSTSPRLNGYQREPMKERFPGIGRYYARDNNRHRIPALIASVRVYTPEDQVEFNKLFAKGDVKGIHAKFGKSVFSMVDGQHRMGGLFYQWAKDETFNTDIPIMLYYGMTYTEEAAYFDDINTTQRKLPRALIEATKVHMEAGGKSHDQYIREISYAVAQDGDSVWQGLVNMTGGKMDPKPPISFEGLRRSTAGMLNDRLVSRLQDRKLDPANVAKRYWQMISKACAPAWGEKPREVFDEDGFIVEEPIKYRLKQLVGLGAVAKLGADILSTSLEKGSEDEDFWSSMASLTSKLGQVDWEQRPDNVWMRASAGFAGVDDLYNTLYALVYLNREPGDPVEEG